MKLYIAEKPAVALDIANALTDGKAKESKKMVTTIVVQIK